MDLDIITLSLLGTVLWVMLTIFLQFQVSPKRLWVIGTWQSLECFSQRNTSMGVRRKQFEVYSSWFGILWISLEWITKLGFQNATPRKVGRSLFELKTRVWNTSCVPLPGEGLSVEEAEFAAWWAFFPQLLGNFSGKWENIFVQTSNLSLFIC